MAFQHIFRPLDKGRKEIRLLYLHAVLPQSNNETESYVAAHFSYTSLSNEQHEKYMALSYVWGEAVYASRVVLDDGSYIPITKNLLVAIEHLFETGFAPVSETTSKSRGRSLTISGRSPNLDRWCLYESIR
jgi:hypothetical protein